MSGKKNNKTHIYHKYIMLHQFCKKGLTFYATPEKTNLL